MYLLPLLFAYIQDSHILKNWSALKFPESETEEFVQIYRMYTDYQCIQFFHCLAEKEKGTAIH